MSLIHSFFGLMSKLFSALSLSPAMSPAVGSLSRVRRLNVISGIVTTAVCLVPMVSPVGAEALPAREAGMIVAAGFGYQMGDTSTITVKIYDAVSGEILSDETFELSVKEEQSAASRTSGGRIFAGGVGLGATDLSNFVLRVYDAGTGRFQWEGQLNLTPVDGAGTGQKISTVRPRHATVTKIHTLEAAVRQPSFLLRALDPSTGGLVWEDEFSADPDHSGSVQRITNRLTGPEPASQAASPAFDFRIRMLDPSGRVVLWEDQVAQREEEDDTHEAADDRAHMLPAWPRLLQQEEASQSI